MKELLKLVVEIILIKEMFLKIILLFISMVVKRLDGYCFVVFLD